MKLLISFNLRLSTSFSQNLSLLLTYSYLQKNFSRFTLSLINFNSFLKLISVSLLIFKVLYQDSSRINMKDLKELQILNNFNQKFNQLKQKMLNLSLTKKIVLRVKIKGQMILLKVYILEIQHYFNVTQNQSFILPEFHVQFS